jgi:two-component system, sensor histidine kinase PdtaS
MHPTDNMSRRTPPRDLAPSASPPPALPRRRRDTSRHYEALAHLVPGALVVTDRTGHIQLANHQVEQLFGYSSGELLGQPVELLVPEGLQFASQHQGAASAAASPARPLSAELPFIGRRRDGSEFPVLVSLNSVVDSGGALFVICRRDGRRRKRPGRRQKPHGGRCSSCRRSQTPPWRISP